MKSILQFVRVNFLKTYRAYSSEPYLRPDSFVPKIFSPNSKRDKKNDFFQKLGSMSLWPLLFESAFGIYYYCYDHSDPGQIGPGATFAYSRQRNSDTASRHTLTTMAAASAYIRGNEKRHLKTLDRKIIIVMICWRGKKNRSFSGACRTKILDRKSSGFCNSTLTANHEKN